jgi:putative ABC transport system permease protein
MFKNYVKIAWRNLFRNKGFSLTNLLGLTIGITCAILILLWVKDEVNYDKSQKNYNEVYQVMGHRNFNNTIFTDESMVLPLAASVEQQVSQVKHAVVTTYRQPYILANGEAKLKKDGYTVSEHFFDVFSYKFMKGNAINAIKEPGSIVLSESAAKALFGDADPINQTVKVDNEKDAKVTAVVADAPGNSTIQFDCIMPFNYADEDVKKSMANWQNSSWQVYLQTMPGAGIAAIEKKINEIKVLHDPGDKKITTYFAFPMSKWRLYSDFKDGKNVGGMIEYVRLFTIIAIIILLIACINFMNLSTARSEKRAKEVGIRKTLGSEKKHLVIQFFFESIILTLISFVLSILLVSLLLPAFNILVEKQLFLDFTQPQFWLVAIAIIVFTGVVAGSYPAIYLSSFSPIKVLKGTFNPGKNAVLPRHFLIVGQFVISILLISATIIVYQQINLVKNKSIGYNPNNLISIPGSPDTQKNYAVIKNELLQSGLISAVTRTLSPITSIYWKEPAPDWAGKPANLSLIFTGLTTDNDFAKTMGVKLLQGKDFSGEPVDSSSVLLSAAAVKAIGLENPIGMQIRRNNKNFTVIGVVDNIVMESPFNPVDPMIVYYNPKNSNWISMRLNKDVQPQQALASIEAVFKKYNPAVPFEYQFVDKEFQRKFLTEDLVSKLANIFALLAIFICCIGLAGLASFTIIKRLREIGVRKVLGATVEQLLLLISKEFLKLVAIAFVIAVPLTWWFMHNWLLKYDYRVNISVWVFVAVGLLMLLLTMAVVGLNTISAAMRNPVKSLKAD